MLAELQINPDSLAKIKGKTVFYCSGIGGATVQLCLQLGARVIGGDIIPPIEETLLSTDLLFVETDVTNWTSIRNLFIQGQNRFGGIDHVFACAGSSPRSNFLDETLDEDGLLAPPNLGTVNVNLIGVINTVRLGVHYLRQSQGEQQPGSSQGASKSIVLAASVASLDIFTAADYTAAKHGVLGLLRGLVGDLDPSIVRLNAIAPSWTASGMVSKELIEPLGRVVQEPEAVAKAVLMLFSERARHGDVAYILDGRHYEIENAPGGLLETTRKTLMTSVSEDEILKRIKKAVAEAQARSQ